MLSRETVDSSLWKSKHKEQSAKNDMSVIITAQTRWRPGVDRKPAADPAPKLYCISSYGKLDLHHRFSAVSQSGRGPITAEM